jgi:hypothetical protein
MRYYRIFPYASSYTCIELSAGIMRYMVLLAEGCHSWCTCMLINNVMCVVDNHFIEVWARLIIFPGSLVCVNDRLSLIQI